MPGHALIMRWQKALPRRPVRCLKATALDRLTEAPDYLRSGEAGQPFDFCASVRRLLDDVALRCADFAHIQPSRILLAMTQARSARSRGLQARVTPLRFARGEPIRQHRGVTYQVQRYFLDDHEFLYLLTFCLPRFLDQPFDEKMITLFHELYHMSPAFDGDLRRHNGRYQIHTHSQRHYDCHMAEQARAYLATAPDPALLAFLRLNFAQLQHRHGSILAAVVPRPRIIPLLGPAAAAI